MESPRITLEEGTQENKGMDGKIWEKGNKMVKTGIEKEGMAKEKFEIFPLKLYLLLHPDCKFFRSMLILIKCINNRVS